MEAACVVLADRLCRAPRRVLEVQVFDKCFMSNLCWNYLLFRFYILYSSSFQFMLESNSRKKKYSRRMEAMFLKIQILSKGKKKIQYFDSSFWTAVTENICNLWFQSFRKNG